jgi:hypothetical protein
MISCTGGHRGHVFVAEKAGPRRPAGLGSVGHWPFDAVWFVRKVLTYLKKLERHQLQRAPLCTTIAGGNPQGCRCVVDKEFLLDLCLDDHIGRRIGSVLLALKSTMTISFAAALESMPS